MKKSKKFINKLAFSLAAAVLCAVAAVAFVFTPGTAAYADATHAVWLYWGSDYGGNSTFMHSTYAFTKVDFVYKAMRYDYDGYVVQDGFTIDRALNVDINGCELKGDVINVTGGTVRFDDLKGGGYFRTRISSGGTAEYHGGAETVADISVYNDGVMKVYSGRIVTLVCTDGTTSNAHRITQVLPDGYAFVAHYSATNASLWSYASANSRSSYYAGGSESIIYLTVQKCSHTSVTNGVCMFCNATIDGAEALKTAREDLAAAKAELEAAIAAKADTATLNEKVTELNTAIKNAEKASKEYADTKDTALKDELTQLINDGDSALQSAIDAVSTNLNQAKADLEAKIKTNADDLLAAKDKYDKEVVAIKKLISDIQATDTTQGEAIKQLQTDLATAESDLQTQITNAISKAESDLATAKSDLNAAIEKKADATALASAITDYDKKISDINGLITAIQGVNTTQGEAIEQLQTDLAAAKTDLEGKITAAAAKANEDLTKAKSELETAIAKKADATALANAITDYNKKISDINDLITAIQGVNTTQGEEIENLKTALNDAKEALQTQINNAISKAESDLATAKSALEAAIAEKADTATLNEKVTELNTAIDNAKKASNAYADTQDNALKEELTNLINSGDSALQTAIDAVSTNLNQAKGELETKIKTNADDLLAAKNKYDKEVDAIKKLISDIQATDTSQGEVIKQLQTDLAAAESNLKTQITNAMRKAESDLAAAKSELNAAIDTKADADVVNEKIAALSHAVENAQAISDASTDKKDEAVKLELQSGIKNAKDALQAAIDALAARVDKAETRIDENAGEIKNLKNIMYLSLGVMFVVGVIVILMCAAMRCTIKAGMGKNGKNK